MFVMKQRTTNAMKNILYDPNPSARKQEMFSITVRKSGCVIQLFQEDCGCSAVVEDQRFPGLRPTTLPVHFMKGYTLSMFSKQDEEWRQRHIQLMQVQDNSAITQIVYVGRPGLMGGGGCSARPTLPPPHVCYGVYRCYVCDFTCPKKECTDCCTHKIHACGERVRAEKERKERERKEREEKEEKERKEKEEKERKERERKEIEEKERKERAEKEREEKERKEREKKEQEERIRQQKEKKRQKILSKIDNILDSSEINKSKDDLLEDETTNKIDITRNKDDQSSSWKYTTEGIISQIPPDFTFNLRNTSSTPFPSKDNDGNSSTSVQDEDSIDNTVSTNKESDSELPDDVARPSEHKDNGNSSTTGNAQ